MTKIIVDEADEEIDLEDDEFIEIDEPKVYQSDPASARTPAAATRTTAQAVRRRKPTRRVTAPCFCSSSSSPVPATPGPKVYVQLARPNVSPAVPRAPRRPDASRPRCGGAVKL